MGPLVLPALNLLGQAGGAIAQGTVNRASRKWNEKMYGIQRQDALADFQMQNEYNHPSSVMKRLRDAGLNPNLVYGSGNATTPSASVRSSDKGSWNPKAPEFNFTEGIAAYIDFKVKEAQVDNLREQNTVLKIESMLKSAQTHKTQIEAETAGEIRPYAVDAARVHVQKMQHETSWIATQEEVARAMKQPNIDKVVQEVLVMKKEALLKDATTELHKIEAQKKIVEIDELSEKIHNLYLDGKLKEYEVRLRALRGVAQDWPGWLKAINDIVTALAKK